MDESDDNRTGGGYVGGAILTVLFFLLVAVLAVGLLAGMGFAVLAMPVTTSLILLFFLAAGIATWRAKLKHDRARRKARRDLDG